MDEGIIAFFIIIVVLLIIFEPVALIWAINVLFGTSITYAFKNWLAAFVILLLMGRPSSSSKKKD